VGSWRTTDAVAAARVSAAGSMAAVWKAPATWSSMTRVPGGGEATRAAIADFDPAATTWPAPFMLAAMRPSAARAASTSPDSPPRTAAIEPGSEAAAAAAIAEPRTATRRTASASLHDAREGGGPELPDRVAGREPGERSPSNSRAVTIAVATSRAGRSPCRGSCPHRTWCRGRSGRCQRRPRGRRGARRLKGSLKPRDSIPGDWAPCPGHTMASTPLGCRIGATFDGSSLTKLSPIVWRNPTKARWPEAPQPPERRTPRTAPWRRAWRGRPTPSGRRPS